MCQPVRTVLEELNKSSKRKRIVYPREMLCQSRSEGWPWQRPLIACVSNVDDYILADMHHVKSEERNEQRKSEREREKERENGWLVMDSAI